MNPIIVTDKHLSLFIKDVAKKLLCVSVYGVVKGCNMSSKLLKVCAAAMLIANEGSATVEEESKTVVNWASEQKSDEQAWIKPIKQGSFKISGKIEAKMDVDIDERQDAINLFKPTGQKTDESERKIWFEPKSNGEFVLGLSGDGGLVLDGKQWKITRQNDRKELIHSDTIDIDLKLYDPGQVLYATLAESFTDLTVNQTGKWWIVFEPHDLEEGHTIMGNYVGKLKVTISAKY